MKKLVLTILAITLLTSCASTLASEGYNEIGNGIYERYDPFYDTTYFRHESSYADFKYIPVSITQIQKDGKKDNALVLRYRGIHWIFFDHAIFLNDKGNSFKIKCDPVREITHTGGVVEEATLILSDKDEASFLSFIIDSKTINLRLVGKNLKDYRIPAEQIAGIKTMLLFK